MTSDTKDLLRIVFVGVLLVCGILAFCIAGSYYSERKACRELGASTGRETSFAYWTDCQVKLQQGWVPVSRWRAVD